MGYSITVIRRRGALISFRKQVHALIFKHYTFHLLVTSACTFMCGDTVHITKNEKDMCYSLLIINVLCFSDNNIPEHFETVDVISLLSLL